MNQKLLIASLLVLLVAAGGLAWLIVTPAAPVAPAPASSILATGDNYELTADRLVLRAPLTAEDTMVHDVHAHTPDGPHSAWSYHYLLAPASMWVTGVKVSVENASSEVIHHLAFGRFGEASPICGGTTHQNFHEYFTVSRTNIHEPTVFPAPYGLFIQAGEPLILEVMTHILEPPHGPGIDTTEPVTVELEFALAGADDVRDKALQFVRLRLDDSPCAEPVAHQAFAVPPQTENFVRRSQDTSLASTDHYRFPFSGVLLARSANVWGTKGGQSLAMLINGEVRETFPTYQGEQPWEWYIDAAFEPYPVAAGDELTIEATYTNVHDTPIKDAAGMFGFYFSPD